MNHMSDCEICHNSFSSMRNLISHVFFCTRKLMKLMLKLHQLSKMIPKNSRIINNFVKRILEQFRYCDFVTNWTRKRCSPPGFTNSEIPITSPSELQNELCNLLNSYLLTVLLSIPFNKGPDECLSQIKIQNHTHEKLENKYENHS